jgi:nicotinamide-nucleotide amidase
MRIMTAENADLYGLAAEVGRLLKSRGFKLVTAESCTGGWIAQVITDVPGSSDWFERGFVTYSNESKCDLLGVDPAIIAVQGAVSAATAEAMVAGALARSRAQVAVAVSGIAGPAGATPDKPVGTVWLAWQRIGGACRVQRRGFDGDRRAVRRAAVAAALQGILDVCRD